MKTLFGILPLVLAVPSYIIYARSVLKGKTIPHMYSWLIWSVLACISFLAQFNSNAGPGSWNTGMTAISCFAIFILAIKYGDHTLTKLDLLLLILAGFTTLSRAVTDSYTLATLLATIAALIGFVFTIKKAYKNPNKENADTFLINGVRNFLSLFALLSISFNTFFYPFSIMLANFAVAIVVLLRKKKLNSKIQL